MKKTVVIFLLFSIFSFLTNAQEKEVLIRADDMGMCHSLNMAFTELINSKIPLSVSVMVACPWFEEAADILKNNPQVSVGVHLTLNSEWKNYKWGPVLGSEAVPSLVDSFGYFFPSRAAFNANNPQLADIEKELRAQVVKAFKAGLQVDYLDYHMGAAVEKPEYREIVEKLAKEFNVGISQYFDEFYSNNMYNDPYDKKADSLHYILNNLRSDKVNLLVSHIGLDTPELSAMEDMNPTGLKEMSKHRQAELHALTSVETRNLIKKNNIKLITYRDLVKRVGVENMKRPAPRN